MTYRTFAGPVMAALVSLGIAGPAAAQEFPSQQIRLVVPFSAGGLTDVMARLMSNEMAERWGQTVIVENVPGSGSLLGAAEVARAEPDGHTILLGSYGLVSNQIILPDSPYDPEELSPVFMLGQTNNILLLYNDHPANSLEEVIEYARENPGDLSFASSGIGSSPHIAAELFAAGIDAEILHIPYPGTAPAMTDVIAGRMDGIFDGVSPGMDYVASGDLKAIAIAAAERHPAAPDVPTFRELGMDFEFGPFWGFFVPVDTPPEVQERIRQDLSEVASMESIRSQIEARGMAMRDISQEEFQAFLDSQFEEIFELIESGNLVIDE